MEEISMGLTPSQYNDIVGFLGNIERLNRGSPYRKYRPVIGRYKKYAKYWWLFAYQCVLEENVRRRRRNWRWSHMKEHKDMVRQYIELYKTKLWQKKEDVKLKRSLEELESRLDVFNITLARRQAEVKVTFALKHYSLLSYSNNKIMVSLQVERMRVNEQKIKEDAEAQQKTRGWFGGWFGSGASSVAVSPEAESVVKSLQAEMTPAEKAKLFNAIGYEENAVPANFPKTFVENRFEFFLKKLVILLHDNTNKKQPVILLSSLSRVEATVEQRPAGQALNAIVKIGNFVIDGTPQDENIPSLVRPLEGTETCVTM
jgi:vacuolar protein sorting-associated protein 13A/C